MSEVLELASSSTADRVLLRNVAGSVELRYCCGEEWSEPEERSIVETPHLLSEAALQVIAMVLKKALEGDNLERRAFHLHNYQGTGYDLYARSFDMTPGRPCDFALLISTDPTCSTAHALVALSEGDALRLQKFLKSTALPPLAEAKKSGPHFGL